MATCRGRASTKRLQDEEKKAKTGRQTNSMKYVMGKGKSETFRQPKY